jgi:hypothetical protein
MSRIALSAALVMVGCGETGLPLPSPNPPLGTICNATVVVQVKSTDPLELSWTPNCRVAKLVVETAAASSERWAIALAAGFNGPLIYADVPPGATVITAAQSLVRGTDYRLRMYADVDGTRLVGAGAFTR